MTSSDHLLVLYASQTGNAEWIAKNIDDQAKERGFESRCLSMDAASEEAIDEARFPSTSKNPDFRSMSV